MELLASWADDGLLGYVAVALAAATPWVEILVVIPPAILLDLAPAPVAATAFLGNYAPVALIIAGHERLDRWSRRRRGRPLAGGSQRSARAQRLLERYGLPGLALLGPLLTGIHLATLLALATGAPRRAVLAWTGASLAAWTAGLTAASVAGVGIVAG